MPEKNGLQIRKYLFLLITFGGLVVIWAVNLLFFLDNPGFVGIALHPYLLLIVIVASLDGFSRAMAATIIVSLSYGVSLLMKLTFHGEEISRIFQFSYFSPFINFLIIGIVIGMITNRQKKNLLRFEAKLQEFKTHVDNLHHELTVLQEKNVALKKKCLTEREFLTMLYHAARKLSSLNLREFQDALIEVLHEVVEADKIAVYMLQGDKLVLCTGRGYQADDAPAPPQWILKKTVEEKRVFSIKEVSAEGKKVISPIFLSGPLSLGEKGEVVGVVWLENIPFLHYTPMTIRLLTILCDWASLCIVNIYAFEALRKKGEEKNRKADFMKVVDTLKRKYKGVFAYGTALSDIEKDLGKKFSVW